ncbi:mechanosensitive ion channel [Haloterrigena sp. SYSU A558-1]|uniref:Mechanosensitive ion channel n=1 Tax=Haloterrigena gelatinilytica TaxID=2741724 RepID=A0A8J8KG87_9EURY|nr:mechanosensitive ion channel domain-containing protein [Haloterrigena gelatinilytica]NUB91797.1 mechanosensitive ion channel [Haloterrigena gelatinilytica]NUC72378.1 mechanosensitive ion channel [Haloterrigena gelatinilytica]
MVWFASVLLIVGFTLRPEPIPDLQRAYLDSPTVQLLATALLAVLLVAGISVASRVQDVARRRHGRQIAEASYVFVLGGLVTAGVYAFTVVWRVTYILEYTLSTMMIDRWLAAQQLVTLAIALSAYLAIRFVNRSIDKLAQTRALTKHQSEVAYHVSDVAIVAFAATMILTLWGIDLTNIFIGAGAITAVVALTARETLTAMLAGFILLFSRPFYVGDWIEVNETSGIVTDVTIFTTKIQTFDDKHVLVPNDEVTDSQLVNYSQNDQLRVDVEVGVDYDTDIDRARSVVVDATEGLEPVKNAPNPQVIAREFGESAILLECRVWIADPTMRRTLQARTDVIEAITTAFDREGIDIPYPHRVHAPREESFPVEGGIDRGSAVSPLED